MADLKAEQILSAITALVTGLTTTTSSVFRGYPYNIPAVPALGISQGSDTPIEDQLDNMSYIDSILQVTITAYYKGLSGAETQANLIRKEVYAAMMANDTLGLNFVHRCKPTGTGKPQIAQGEQPVSAMDINFDVFYRHNYIDASA